jgi:hypothetical protein
MKGKKHLSGAELIVAMKQEKPCDLPPPEIKPQVDAYVRTYMERRMARHRQAIAQFEPGTHSFYLCADGSTQAMPLKNTISSAV